MPLHAWCFLSFLVGKITGYLIGSGAPMHRMNVLLLRPQRGALVPIPVQRAACFPAPGKWPGHQPRPAYQHLAQIQLCLRSLAINTRSRRPGWHTSTWCRQSPVCSVSFTDSESVFFSWNIFLRNWTLTNSVNVGFSTMPLHTNLYICFLILFVIPQTYKCPTAYCICGGTRVGGSKFVLSIRHFQRRIAGPHHHYPPASTVALLEPRVWLHKL